MTHKRFSTHTGDKEVEEGEYDDDTYYTHKTQTHRPRERGDAQRSPSRPCCSGFSFTMVGWEWRGGLSD